MFITSLVHSLNSGQQTSLPHVAMKWPDTRVFNFKRLRTGVLVSIWLGGGGRELTTFTTDLAGHGVLQGEFTEGLEERGAGIHMADILNLDLKFSRMMSHVLPPERNKVLAITGGYHIIRIQGGSKCSPSSLAGRNGFFIII